MWRATVAALYSAAIASAAACSASVRDRVNADGGASPSEGDGRSRDATLEGSATGTGARDAMLDVSHSTAPDAAAGGAGDATRSSSTRSDGASGAADKPAGTGGGPLLAGDASVVVADAADPLALSTLGCSAPSLAAGQHVMTVRSGGMDRTYLLWIPPVTTHDPTKPAAVVIELHGGGGRAASFDAETGWSLKGAQAGFLVVAPDGTVGKMVGTKDKEYWNSGPTCGAGTQQQVDDVGFIRDLLQQVSRMTCVDAKRIFATGHSEGGGMAHRLACEASDLIAAIAPASAAANLYPQDPATHPDQTPAYKCDVKIPVSVFEMHGLLDCTNPYQGGYVTGGGCALYNPNVPACFSWWAANDRCHGGAGPATVTDLPSGEGQVSCSSQLGCPSGIDVELCTFSRAGHEWFGSGKDPCTAFDPNVVPVTTWRATDHAWSFFVSHPKP